MGIKKDKQNIYVTKSFLPPIEEYESYIEKIWSSDRLTNQGPLLQELEASLQKYLDIKDIQVVTNGTIALQLAFKALEIDEGEIITTPFSYVASVSSILWEKLNPVFVDIESDTFCIDANKIEEKITEKTKAILVVHVFGVAPNIEKIEKIAKKHNLKVIFDGAHAFGSKYKNKSLLSFGDISTCSFHATKLFHTVEGGCVIAKDKNVSDKISLIKKFGHYGDDHYMLGINAKASEFHAAMGLCNLKYINKNIEDRKINYKNYKSYLNENIITQNISRNSSYNYSYYPIVLNSEDTLLKVMEQLKKINVFPRRYFYPSLNKLPYIENNTKCPVSEDISKRILCLPLYSELKEEDIKEICKVVNEI